MSVIIKIKNNYKESKTGYLRFQGQLQDITKGDTITHSGSGDGKPIDFKAGQELEFKVDQGQDIISGTFWVNTADKRKWKNIENSDDKSGPQCSQTEFTIDSNVVSYDISAVEGLCDSYKMYFKPDNENAKNEDILTCSPNMINTFSKWTGFVPSDKNNPDYNNDHRNKIGCEAQDCQGKKICHNYVKEHSYGKSDGYCQWLYDQGCKGYCWAYDEMKCPNDKKCIFDNNGNPMYKKEDKIINCVDCDCLPNSYYYETAWKQVDGTPTNPQPKREDGILFIEFGPLINDISPSETKTNKIIILIILFVLCIVVFFILFKLLKK